MSKRVKLTLGQLESCANVDKIAEYLDRQSSLHFRILNSRLYEKLMPISVSKHVFQLHEFRSVPGFRWASHIRRLLYFTDDSQKLPKIDTDLALQMTEMEINGSQWYSGDLMDEDINFLDKCTKILSLNINFHMIIQWDLDRVQLPSSLTSLIIPKVVAVSIVNLPRALQVLHVGSLVIEPTSVFPPNLKSLEVYHGFELGKSYSTPISSLLNLCSIPMFPDSLTNLFINVSGPFFPEQLTILSLPLGLLSFGILEASCTVTVACFPLCLQRLSWNSYAEMPDLPPSLKKFSFGFPGRPQILKRVIALPEKLESAVLVEALPHLPLPKLLTRLELYDFRSHLIKK